MNQPWSIRPDATNDRAAIRRVVEAAFPTVAEADLMNALRRDREAWIDSLSWVATDGEGSVIGYALLTRCSIGLSPALCLAPVAVHPACQRRGVGTAVVNAVLEAARALGEPCVIVLGDPSYYGRFGFQRASSFGIYLPMDVPDEASMVMALQDDVVLPAGTVRYPDAFELV